MISVIKLPRFVQGRLDAAADAFLHPQNARRIDFTRPLGEAAFAAPDSVSWRICKNPVALFVGGVAAVILELAEPHVRSGVWQHSSFRKDPLGRLRRTGMAAMITVYGARSIAEPMIAGVVRMHGKVAGETPAGAAYSANDAHLLTWVQATASWGFAEAYDRYVAPLGAEEFDALYREALPTSRLYGALHTPGSNAEVHALIDSMRGRLEPSPIVHEFLDIMHATPAFPRPLHAMQHLFVRAAVDLIPDWVRACLGLTSTHGLRPHEKPVVKLAGALADRIVLSESPAAQACRRLGLPVAHLYG